MVYRFELLYCTIAFLNCVLLVRKAHGEFRCDLKITALDLVWEFGLVETLFSCDLPNCHSFLFRVTLTKVEMDLLLWVPARSPCAKFLRAYVGECGNFLSALIMSNWLASLRLRVSQSICSEGTCSQGLQATARMLYCWPSSLKNFYSVVLRVKLFDVSLFEGLQHFNEPGKQVGFEPFGACFAHWFLQRNGSMIISQKNTCSGQNFRNFYGYKLYFLVFHSEFFLVEFRHLWCKFLFNIPVSNVCGVPSLVTE